MNHIEAIQKLISRNRAFVRKNGASDYSRETDELINALLAYVKQSDAETARLEAVEQNRNVCFSLYAIPDEFKDMEPEFIERYIKFDIVPEMWLLNGKRPEDFILTETSILEYYKLSQKRIEKDFEMYKLAQQLIDNPEQMKTLFPEFATFINHGYTDEQVKQELKRKIYYNHE